MAKEWVKLNHGRTKRYSLAKRTILISQEDYDKLEEDEKEGKYSSEKIESYFTLSNPLLAVEELCQAQFYGLWRISCTWSENCQKMLISLC